MTICQMVTKRFSLVASAALSILITLLGSCASVQERGPGGKFRETSAEVDGYTLHYRIGGNGPVLLMLHGMTLTGEQWMPFAKNFADAHTVVVVDLPGHGGSSPFPEAFSFAETAELMHGLLDELGARQAYGIGHSAGGMTLLHMAAQQPQRIKAMVLVDAPHYLGEAARKIVLEDTWEKLDAGVQAWYRTLHPGGEEQAKRIYRQYNGFANTSERLSADKLKSLPTNTLLVWGDRDPAFPLELPMEMYRALPNAALWVIPQQGHTPLWEDMGGDDSAAAVFRKIAKEFLAQEQISGGDWF